MECPTELKRYNLVCLDIETTGLNLMFDQIIEFGCIEVKDGIITTEYQTLFGGGRSPVYLVKNVHGIRDSERIGKPTFQDRGMKIANYLSNKVLVGHNIRKFDIPMIINKLNDIGATIENYKICDTLQIAKKIGHESNKLENLCKYYGIQYGGSLGNRKHRGLDDAKSTLDLLYTFVNKHGWEVVFNHLK